MRINKEGSLTQKFDDVGEAINDIANTAVVKVTQAFNKDANFDASRRNAIHSTLALPAQLFYLNILMKRPAFWISTILTSPFATSRQLFRDGKPLETLKAVAAGTSSMMYGGSIAKRRLMREMANESDIFGQHLTNEVGKTGTKFLSGGDLDTVRGIGGLFTGATEAMKAESISRYWAASIAYEYYKDKYPNNLGALKLQIENFVGTTMVMYGAQHSSPLLQKTGVLGQAAGQLTKYPTAQLGNLVADFQHMSRKDMKTMLPFLSTLASSMIAGGMAGTVLVAEYEILAALVNKMAEFLGLEQRLPTAERAMFENT